jgi:hypothetical protein
MSGFVPGFENDLFISYSHADDLAWIQAFEKSLAEELVRRLGHEVAVWQDGKRLRVGQNWQTEIEAGVQGAAVFIAVLSPSYENSDWCKRERDFFRQLFKMPDAFANSKRFFKVLKTPWENDGHKYFLPAIQSLAFFHREDGSADDFELLPGTGEFRTAIVSLANSVKQTLYRLRRERERVFVGSPAKDCLDVWNQLREELRNQGYDVQPAGRRDPEFFTDELVRGEMDKALLSVHLLGASYDAFVERQITLSADLEQRLLFWLAPGTGAEADAPQRQLVEVLENGLRPDRTSAKLPPGWSLRRELTPRALIQEVLASLKPKPAAAPPADSSSSSHVYIVHDATTPEDSRIAAELRDQIEAREGLSVSLSRADLSSAAELRLRHEKLMQTCDGVLLCRKDAPEQWLKEMAPEVIFAEKLLKRGPFKSRALLTTDPALWTGFLQTITYKPPLSLQDLEPFLAPLRGGGGTNGR